MNSNLLFEALFIPLIIIFIGSTAKKLARGRGWKREDFFFGIELTLSAISGGLTLLFDSSIDAANSQRAGLLITIAFGLFIYVLSLYQEYQNTTPKQEYIWLTFFSNTIGVGLMAILVFWIKS